VSEVENVSKKTTKKVAKKATKKTTKKATKKVAKKTTKVAKKATKKTAKKVTKKVTKKVEMSAEELNDNLLESKVVEPVLETENSAEILEKQETVSVKPKAQKEGNLILNVSETLKRKLIETSQDEGIGVEDLAAELLGEGLVLRAWEIIERKSAMSGNSNGNQQQSKGKHYQNKGGYKQQGHFKRGKKGGNGNGNGNGNKKNNYNRIMDDNANFLEYVRNQENRNR
jgi:hypothetical protein